MLCAGVFYTNSKAIRSAAARVGSISGGSYVSTTNPDMMPVAVAELGPGKYQVS